MNNGNDLVRIGAMIRLFDEWTVSTNSDGISFLFFFFFFLLQKFSRISREIWNNLEEGRNVISGKRSGYGTGSDLEAGTGSGIPVIGKSGNASLRRFDIGIPGRV